LLKKKSRTKRIK